jgi:hypothetical protein
MLTQKKWLALVFIVLTGIPFSASAENLTLWLRDNGASTLATHVVDHWNETHPADHITLTLIPHERYIPTFTEALAAGKAPDLLSLDLILMPDFMKAGYVKDITDPMAGNPNVKKVVPAHIALATYEKRMYGIPFVADDSLLFYNKVLFRKAGLDPEKPPASSGEIVVAARRYLRVLFFGPLPRLQYLHGCATNVGRPWHGSAACRLPGGAARRRVDQAGAGGLPHDVEGGSDSAKRQNRSGRSRIGRFQNRKNRNAGGTQLRCSPAEGNRAQR